MKSWGKWILAVLLAWLLLFLSLLCHILDLRSTLVPRSRTAEESGFTRTETRHLASVVQGGSRTPGWSRRLSGEDWRMRRTNFRTRSRDYYRRWSLDVLHRLWTRNLTARMLSPRLQKVLKVQLSSNKHQVVYRGLEGVHRSSLQLYCDLKRRIRIWTLDGTEEPFFGLGWDRLVPSLTLLELQRSQYRSCALVTSAGAVLNSSLGTELDSHDAVLRFNTAPTRGFERDVGNKTTIRIINSQVSVYEFIPSVRQTDLCHYHERYYDAACTLGAYHPLLYEKLLVQRINEGHEDELRRKGKVTPRGFSSVDCGT